MFRWEVQLQVINGRDVERIIVRADNIEGAYKEALTMAGYTWDIYSIHKIWD